MYDDLRNMLYLMVSKKDVHCKDLGIELLMELLENKKYLEFVELLIIRNIDVNIRDENDRNILMYLLIIANEEVKNYDLDLNEENYDICLDIERIALSYEVMGAVELLLNKGVMINLEDREGNVALDYAFKTKFFNVVRLLLERGAKISEVSNKYVNAKFFDMIYQDKLFLKLILKQDINLDYQDDNGMTLLMFATKKGDSDLVRYLIKKGVDINKKNNYGDTALIIACAKGYFDITGVLLDENANLDCRNSNGLTALMYACIKKHIGIVRMLLEENVDLDVRDKNGRTALMIAASNEDEEIINLLIDKGARVDIKNNSGFSLLNDLCRRKSADLLGIIVKKTNVDSDINLVARLALGYINYEKNNNIKELKKVVLAIPSKRKLKIYKQFFKEMEGKFDLLFEQKTLRYKILMKVDSTFFNTLNTINQILNKENNIGNSLEKLYLVMTGFCGMIRRYYSSSNVFIKKFTKSVKDSACVIMNSGKEESRILSIEKALGKIKKDELLFFLTNTKAGNIHNIPEIVFKINKGPLKDRYALLLVNFGYGFDLNDLGASQVSMYIFSMDTQNELKKIAKKVFDVSNDFGNMASNPANVRVFYEKVHNLFFRESKRIIKSVYDINDISDNKVFSYADVPKVCAKINENLGIVLRFGNNMPKNINNCFIKQQQKALEVIFSILKTCYDNKNNPDFDIVLFMRNNSLDDRKTLIYTHLNGLFVCDVEEKEKNKKGIDSEKFKKELSEEILKVVVNGYEVKNKGIKKITKQEAYSIKQELFEKNKLDMNFAR